MGGLLKMQIPRPHPRTEYWFIIVRDRACQDLSELVAPGNVAGCAEGKREDKAVNSCVVRPRHGGNLEVNALEKLCGQSDLIAPQRHEICDIYTPTSITP